MLSPADLGQLFASFEHDAFRLELLPAYQVPEEAAELAAYVAGDPAPAGLGGDTDWRTMLRTGREAGKRYSRLHVVRSPLSAYLRYECEWGYVFNAGYGEDIRILDLAEVDYDGVLPPRDFWLFDNRVGVWQRYTDDGTYDGAELATPAEVDRLRVWRDEFMRRAVPFTAYWAAHPQFHRGNR